MSTPMFVAGALLAVAAVVYQPPVDAPVVDRFRPPATTFGPGNRGLEYATQPGQVVRAAAPGVVAFAGRVGDSLHVSIVHADGVRTTYSYLDGIEVRRGERLAAGRPIGRAGPRFHLGARIGDAYVDPQLLFGAGHRKRHAHLVGDEEGR